MDKRQTVESIKAHQIFAEIKDLAHPFLKTYTVLEFEAQKVAQNLRKLVDTETVTVTVKNTVLYVGTKQYRLPITQKNNELVKMVRKLAMSVDNERLYEEAMELVRSI